MADLFKSLQHKAHPSKSGFDLSRKHVFSSKPGLAVPCLAVETVPGDHFEIDVTALSRTQTFNTAAFVRGKQRFDFYFVPNAQAWHPFNQFVTQRTDKHSTQQLGHMYCPVVSLGTIHLHILSERDNNFKDMFGFSYADSMIRVLDMLGYGDFRWLLDSALTVSNYQSNQLGFYSDKYVNLFRVAAYQHIWYDIYRNKYYDVIDSGGIGALPSRSDFVSAFNFDDLACDTFANSVLADGSLNSSGAPDPAYIRFRRIFSCNYIQWKKDLYTSAMPGQQFGVVSAVDISGVNIVSDANISSQTSPVVGAGSNNGIFFVSGSSSSDSFDTRSKWSLPSAFDVLSLRKAEALQQWKMNTLRGGNQTDDAFESHFGVKPYYDADENVHYLGSFSSALQVNTVEATAQTSSVTNGAVGDLAATGTILTQGHKIKFDSKDFGVIMCIASYLPEAEYSSNALDKANTLHEQFDYFTPEYQNIGLEAVPLHEVSFQGEANAFNSVLGFAPRYYMYKTAVDKVFGEFKDTESLWTQGGSYESMNGSLYPWVSPRPEAFLNYGSIVSRLLRTFYVSPAIYNNVFGVNADSSQTTDNFIHNVYFDIKAIRPMTVLGLPQF